MQTNKPTYQELLELSPVVANLPKNNNGVVPPFYFENLPAEVLLKVQNNQQAPVYHTPKGYFEALPQVILQRLQEQNNVHTSIVNEEIRAISPLLASINKGHIYEVPTGYFNSLTITPQPTQKAPVLSLFSLQKWSGRVAAAIIFSLVLGAGLLLYLNKSTNTSKQLAKLSEDEITHFLSNASPVETTYVHEDDLFNETAYLFTGASTDELKTYLNEQTQTAENLNN